MRLKVTLHLIPTDPSCLPLIKAVCFNPSCLPNNYTQGFK